MFGKSRSGSARCGLLFVAVCFFVLAANVDAKPVPLETARLAATNWMHERAAIEPQQAALEELSSVDNEAQGAYYVFNCSPEGFVIVAADDVAYPIIFYSKDGHYTGQDCPPQFDFMMEMARDEILAVQEERLDPTVEVSAAWKRLETRTANFEAAESIEAVSPLLTTTWDQDEYYNELCPTDGNGPGGHVYAGCVAVAMAQIMKYHNSPREGRGSHSYFHPAYGTISADFGATTYNWGNMPNSISSSNLDVARLLFHAGVGVEMNYGPGGSGASTSDARDALIDYFGYQPSANYVRRSSYSSSQWLTLMKTDLGASRPIYYRGD